MRICKWAAREAQAIRAKQVVQLLCSGSLGTVEPDVVLSEDDFEAGLQQTHRGSDEQVTRHRLHKHFTMHACTEKRP